MSKISYSKQIVVLISVACLLYCEYVIFQINQSALGGDHTVYCRAADVARTGGNPYLTESLGTHLSWDYLPIYLDAFTLFCFSRLSSEVYYPIYFTLLLILSVVLWQPKEDWLFAVALASCAFFGFGWSLHSGNIAPLELLFLSIGIAFIKRNKWTWAAIFLGLLASIKLLPAVYLAIFLFAPPGKGSRVKATLFGILGFIIPIILSALIHPDLMIWYARQVLGMIPNQHAPIHEAGGWNNPSLPNMLAAIAGGNSSASSWLGIGLTIVLVTLGLIWAYRYILPRTPESERPQLIFMIGLLALSLALPRVQPYSFILFSPVLYWFLRRESSIIQAIVLIIAGIGGIAAYNACYTILDLPVLPFWLQYSQMILLLICIGVIFLSNKIRLSRKQGPYFN